MDKVIEILVIVFSVTLILFAGLLIYDQFIGDNAICHDCELEERRDKLLEDCLMISPGNHIQECINITKQAIR